MTAVAELLGVSASLGGRAVLRDIALTISAGEVVAVIGPNGAGKSSLLKILAGLLPASAGRVALLGRDAAALPPSERACQVAYLPQQRAIHWPLPARGIVALGRLPHQTRGATDEARDKTAIDAAMRAMDVLKFADRPVLHLSGGEQARVLMARALAQDPKLLLADEPTAALDIAHQLALAKTLRDKARQGVACVVALHDLALAADVADRVVLMADGQIVAAGRPRDVLTEARVAQVYGVRMRIASVDDALVFVPQPR